MGFFNMAGGVITSLIIKKIGFKTIFVLGLYGQSISYLIFLFGYVFRFPFQVIAGTYLYIFTFACSLGACLYPYQTAILEPVGIGVGSLP